MEIKTASGIIVVNKKSTYAKFLQGYQSTGAFDGSGTLSAAWRMFNQLGKEYKSVSAYDRGKMIGVIFKYQHTFAEDTPGSKFLDSFINSTNK